MWQTICRFIHSSYFFQGAFCHIEFYPYITHANQKVLRPQSIKGRVEE